MLVGLLALAVVVAIVAVAGFLLIHPGAPDIRVSEAGSEYRFESPGFAFHSTPGEYYLVIDLLARNVGSGPGSLAFSDFRLNATGGLYDRAVLQPTAYMTLAPGGQATVTVAFAVNATDGGYRLEYRGQAVSVPAPPPPPPEFDMHVDNVTANSEDNNGFRANPGYAFQWVNLTFANLWHGGLEMNVFYFLLEDAAGARYPAHTVIGPGTIAPGASAHVTVIWETPSSAVPFRISFDQVLGPWGTVTVS